MIITCDFLYISDLLPLLVYVLVQSGLVTAEVEAEYMWGLLHPCVLAGEAGYYLTTLSSAIQLLKNIRVTMETHIRQVHNLEQCKTDLFLLICTFYQTFLLIT